jgi:DNA-binding CsgD family transcriptional regulator
VHAAALRSIDGVGWDQIGDYIDLTARQIETIRKAGDHGLKNGYTIPFRLPGMSSAMFSVALGTSRPLTARMRLIARLLGSVAFARAHEISSGRIVVAPERVRLSPRQIDCISLVALGLSDFEIARHIGLSPGTVREYIETARQRYGVKRRTQLVLAAIRDGHMSLDEAV